MKINHYFILLLIISLISISCSSKKKDSLRPDLSNTNYIYIDNKTFKHKNDTFFPIMLNYVIACRSIDNKCVISPIKSYENPNIYESNTEKEILHQLSGHFQLIHELGFNCLRLCFDRISQDKKGHYFYQADNKKYYIKEHATEIIQGFKQVINIAGEKNLRVMLLIKPPIQNKELQAFTIKLLKTFKDNPVIFAYDFMNEPLYFDQKKKRSKKEAVKIVSQWRDLMRKHAPNQLFTIGFSEPIEVFEWDPQLLPVDFVQFHTYHPLRVPNEIYWYSHYIDKAWMIGETALPADGDSISYEEQAQFMLDAFHYSVDCGGSGFGWWEFQEIPGSHFEAQYTGLLNHQGITFTTDSAHIILGTLKPAAHLVKELTNYKAKKPVQAVNYYNMLGFNNICIKGKIVDKKTKQAVEGAVVRAWNEYWSVGINTFTNEKGEFTLYSNDECVHFEISAPGMTKIKFDKKITYHPVSGQKADIHQLPNKDLEYQRISYKPFLLQSNTAPYPLFHFDPEKFNQAKFTGDMGPLYLKKIK
ncbi:MAG: cellulase family glycosylhydrolase [Bacteroidales bacterium]|nr:cellulase family glycosylhydrolase [Bacteroidales bacterium]